ncbi:hypothetical protein Tco_0691595 [Tanacetum coccineum]
MGCEGGEDGDMVLMIDSVVMWMMVECGVARLEWPEISPDNGREKGRRRIYREREGVYHLEKEVILANNLLGEMNRYMLQKRSLAEEETRVHSLLLDQPLNNYGLHTLLMTSESNKRITTALEAAREEVMRSINEK